MNTSDMIADHTTAGPVLEEAIRQRAYGLYLEGGSQDGHDVEDWLKAEQEQLVFLVHGLVNQVLSRQVAEAATDA